MTLEGFVVAAETTGGDVLARVSAAEASCVRREVGDGGYDTLAGTVLLEAGADPAFASPMAACLSEDNFVVYSTAIIAANAGARNDESRACLIALGRANPEFAYITFGVGDEYLASFDPQKLPSFGRELLGCLTTGETVRFVVPLFELIAAQDPMTGSDFLAVMSEDTISCYLDTFGITREQFEMFIEMGDQSGSDGSGSAEADNVGAECISPDTLLGIFLTIASRAAGGLSDESTRCLAEFATENPEYVDFVMFGGIDPETLTDEEAEQYTFLATGSLLVYACLNVTELLPLQVLVIDLLT